MAPSADEGGGEGNIVNKQNSNYFSPLASEEEENTLIVNVIQEVRNRKIEISETESESETESLSDKKSKSTGIKRKREEDVTLGLTPKRKRKRRHSKDVQEEKNDLEESIKKLLSLNDKKTKITPQNELKTHGGERKTINTHISGEEGETLLMKKPNEVTEGLNNEILNTQKGEGEGETLLMKKPNEVTKRLNKENLNTQKGERQGETLSMIKPEEVTESLENDVNLKFHEEWNRKEEEKRKREKRIALFEAGKRKNMSSNSNRQDSWAKWQSATNLAVKKKMNKEKELPLDERKLLTRLALRLEMNGIQVDGDTTIPSEMDVDPNTHPSRKHLMRKETSLAELLERPEIKESLKDCDHVNWSLLEVAGVESELEYPTQSGETPEKDTKPILYGMIKGVMAKIYIDQGAQVSVISEAFVQSNAIDMSVLRNPVKLKMANGMIEPSFNKVHSVAFKTGDLDENEGKNQLVFSEKITAFVAPLKGYDAIIGRDNLSKWQAILDLRSKEDIMKELEDKGIQRVIPRNPCDGMSVYDRKKKKRINQ